MDRHVRSQLRLKVLFHARSVGSAAWLLICCAAFLAACSDAPEIAERPLTTIPAEPASTTIAPALPTIDDDEQADTAPAVPDTLGAPLSGTLTATVVDTHPHDIDAFTQGLEILNGRFIEGTGLYGESDRRIVDIESGETVLAESIDADLFG